jgi:peroxiredoxin
MEKLNVGDTFPNFDIQTVAHGQIRLPRDFAGRYAVLLFYRGGW